MRLEAQKVQSQKTPTDFFATTLIRRVYRSVSTSNLRYQFQGPIQWAAQSRILTCPKETNDCRQDRTCNYTLKQPLSMKTGQ